MIQVRNVSDRLHRELMRRARQQGHTLTEYVEGILEREAARPSPDELFERISSRQPVTLRGGAAEVVRDERGRAGKS